MVRPIESGSLADGSGLIQPGQGDVDRTGGIGTIRGSRVILAFRSHRFDPRVPSYPAGSLLASSRTYLPGRPDRTSGLDHYFSGSTTTLLGN